MKKMKLWGLLSLFLLALSACSESASDTQSTSENQQQLSLIERIEHQGTISVGTEGTYAPFTYHDSGGKLTGYDVEVTRAVAKKLNITVEFKETQWDAMLAGLKSGRFDVVANQVSLTTAERQATFDKSAEYSFSGPMAVNRKGDQVFNHINEIKGLSLAQSLSSNYGELAVGNGAQVVPVDGMAQALKLVQQNRADMTLNDSLALLDYLHKNPESGLQIAWRAGSENKLGAGFIVNKGNEKALSKISQAVEELRVDGTLKALGEQFFGMDVSEK